MAVYEYEVIANKTPIVQIFSGSIAGTAADTLIFARAMTRLVVKNTGTAVLTVKINNGAALTDVLAAGEVLDDSFLEFGNVVLSGTTGSSYKVMVG